MTAASSPPTDRRISLTVSSSLRDFAETFRAASEPPLEVLVGRHRAVIAGPWWVRPPSRAIVHLTGMPGWWGKEFAPADDGSDMLTGHNIVETDGALRPSLAMQARLGPSRVDGRLALLLTYPSDAPFPWRTVTDEVRQVDGGLLLGLSFVVPYLPPGGSPFLLRTEDQVSA